MAPLSSLRSRLLGLVLVAVLPSFGILAYAERNHRALLLRNVEEEAQDLARLVAERHQRAVDRARGLLSGLASLPSLRRLDGRACSAELARTLEDAPLYANVGAVLRDGTLFCSAAPLSTPVHLADRAHVRGALETGEFTVGGFMVSRSRGVASFGFGQPVRDASGAVLAVAVASFDLGQLQRDLDTLHLPDGAEVFVTDRDGLVITGRPAPGEMTGHMIDGRILAAARDQTLAELPGGDGAPRIFAFHAVGGAGGDVAMRVSVGVPAAVAQAPVNRIVRNSVLAFLAVALVALVLAAVGAGRSFSPDRSV